MPSPPLTVVCLASYFKGLDFLRQCRDRGCRVLLVTKDRLRDEAWPHEAIDRVITVPNDASADEFVHAVSEVARTERVDRVVALEEFDVQHAALLREHLRVPGMGTTTARLFRDKLAMRVKAHDAGVPVPDFVHVLNEDELRGYMAVVPPPWVLKPRSDVSAVGIQKLHDPALVWQAISALDARPALNERSSYYLLERFVAGDVYHVDSLVQHGTVVFAGVNRYWRPPMDVAHNGGVFVTTTLPEDAPEHATLVSMNAAVLRALNFVRGATHAEFIRDRDGTVYFLEVAARVGGAFIAEVLEAATGINLWREWANVEIARDDDYTLPAVRRGYAGIALALARQEWPDTSSYADPEIVLRVQKNHHVGLIVRADTPARVDELLGGYVARFTDEFLAVLPPRARAQS